MDKEFKFKQKETGIENLSFELVQIDEAVKLEASFSVSVNSKNVHQVKLNCKVTLFSDDHENPFMSVDIYGLYATNNEDPELSLDKITGKREFMRDLVPKINEIIGFITEEGLDQRMTVPESLVTNEI